MINYISAHNGGIKMFAGSLNLKGWGKTAKSIAYTLKTVGLADRVMGSTSMHFASNQSFWQQGDAFHVRDEAIAIYNWEVNGVAG